jgi:hypothetical protein
MSRAGSLPSSAADTRIAVRGQPISPSLRALPGRSQTHRHPTVAAPPLHLRAPFRESVLNNPTLTDRLGNGNQHRFVIGFEPARFRKPPDAGSIYTRPPRRAATTVKVQQLSRVIAGVNLGVFRERDIAVGIVGH